MINSWTNFFIAAAGGSAALAGLVIVAVSVNLSSILKFRHLPARAGATIGTLILILVASMAALIPQSLKAFGIEIVFVGVVCWLQQLWAARLMLVVRKERNRPWHETAIGITLGQIQTLPFIASGVMLSVWDARGLYWMAGGVIAVFIFSMFNAWVLLVEILR